MRTLASEIAIHANVYCVSRSRREHVHGRGEARGRVERVVPCL